MIVEVTELEGIKTCYHTCNAVKVHKNCVVMITVKNNSVFTQKIDTQLNDITILGE